MHCMLHINCHPSFSFKYIYEVNEIFLRSLTSHTCMSNSLYYFFMGTNYYQRSFHKINQTRSFLDQTKKNISASFSIPFCSFYNNTINIRICIRVWIQKSKEKLYSNIHINIFVCVCVRLIMCDWKKVW